MTSAGDVIAALASMGRRVKPCGSGWIAQSPLREDRHPSLSIGARPDGTVLLHDHGSALPQSEQYRRILGAIGLGGGPVQAVPHQRPCRSFDFDPPVDMDPDAPERCRRRLIERDMAGGVASSLGVDAQSLMAMGAGWSDRYSGATFPMYTSSMRICGLRVRAEYGKVAYPGSRNGLFTSVGDLLYMSDEPLFIVEGASDTAALLSEGLVAIGRPSATARIDWTVAAALRYSRSDIIIVKHADSAGERGACMCADRLARCGRVVKVLTPRGGADAREAIVSGSMTGGQFVRSGKDARRWIP